MGAASAQERATATLTDCHPSLFVASVANAFANAVASKSITYSQAVMIAVVAESFGAMALGNNVTDTIRSKVVNVKLFENDPYMLMLAMSTTSIGSAVWVLSATALQMPVSTTHATVGAVMGVGITAFGPDGVNWGFDGSFAGFGGIVASWFISPVIAGILASIIYLSVKFFVLSQPDEISFQRGIKSLPFYGGITFGIIGGFMIFKGIPLAKKFSGEYEKSIPVVFAIAIICGIIVAFTAMPWVRRFVADNENLPWYTIPYVMCVPVGAYGYYEEGTHDFYNKNDPMNPNAKASAAPAAASRAAPAMPAQMSNAPSMQMPNMAMPMQPMGYPAGGMPMPMPMASMQQYPMQGYPAMGSGFGQPIQVVGAGFGKANGEDERPRVNGIPMYYTTNDKWYDTILRKMSPGFYVDIDALCEECAELHSHANHFYDKTERLYKVLQISSCFFASVSHGANDIANSIGPLSAVYAIYISGTVNSKSGIDYGVLFYGVVCLDLGLILMGHQIMMVLGNKLTYQTPSRGFCMEVGAMFTVLVFSKLGVPVSTTHCITGATAGVGLCNGDVRAINWKLIVIICAGWVITCPAAGLCTGLIFWGLGTTPHATPGNGFFGEVTA